MIQADQIFLTLQQLANKNNSANLHNNINRTSKLKNLFITTMLVFNGKYKRFELFECLLQTRLKIHKKLTEDDTINYFHCLMKGDALQTFKNINGPTRGNLGEILAAFCKKYMKPKLMATAKHKFQKLVFNPGKHKLVDFLDELQKLAKNAFRKAAHAIIEHLIYAIIPSLLKKSISLANLEDGTYEHIVTHSEKELGLNGLEAPEELQINTVCQHAASTKADRHKPTCHHCKKLKHYRNQCRPLKKKN